MDTNTEGSKRKIRLSTLILAAVALALLLFASFFKQSDSPLARHWQVNNDKASNWFFADSEQGKTFVFQSSDGQKTGSWALNGQQLKLTYDIDTTQKVAEPPPTPTNSLTTDSLATPPPPPPKKASPTNETATFNIQQSSDNEWLLSGATGKYALKDTRSFIGKLFDNDLLRGLIGIFSLLFIAYLFSANRRRIDWDLVMVGISLQLIFAVAVLQIPIVRSGFEFVSNFFVLITNFALEGAAFVFGGLVTNMDSFGFIFAFQVLPTIVFYAALSAILYYLGILQKIVYGFAWVMSRTMRLSGSESLAAAANIFIGQTEAPLIVKPYLEKMTTSEIMCLMTGGMATIAGGVFAAYIGFLGGSDPAQQLLFATHLLSASIMSAPAAIVAAKILFPEDNPEQTNRNIEIHQEDIGSNFLDAITQGSADGLKLAVNVAVMLMVFMGLVYLANAILHDFIGHYTGLNGLITEWSDGTYEGLKLQYVFGFLFAPLAWLIGVPMCDIVSIGQLIGEKTLLNEFFAYTSLSAMKNAHTILDPKSLLIATYALCGFSNFGSIGIQIGGIGAIAPGQRQTLSSLGIKALIGGTIACLLTGVIAGMLVG